MTWKEPAGGRVRQTADMNRACFVGVARRAAVLCFSVMLSASPALSQPRSAQSFADWQEDLESLVTTIRTHHVAPYTTAPHP